MAMMTSACEPLSRAWGLVTGLPIGVKVGLYWNNAEENGNYYIVYRGYIGRMENKMETTIGFRVSGTNMDSAIRYESIA